MLVAVLLEDKVSVIVDCVDNDPMPLTRLFPDGQIIPIDESTGTPTGGETFRNGRFTVSAPARSWSYDDDTQRWTPPKVAAAR